VQLVLAPWLRAELQGRRDPLRPSTERPGIAHAPSGSEASDPVSLDCSITSLSAVAEQMGVRLQQSAAQ